MVNCGFFEINKLLHKTPPEKLNQWYQDWHKRGRKKFARDTRHITFEEFVQWRLTERR